MPALPSPVSGIRGGSPANYGQEDEHANRRGGGSPMAELTLLLVFALYAGVMGLLFQLFGR